MELLLFKDYDIVAYQDGDRLKVKSVSQIRDPVWRYSSYWDKSLRQMARSVGYILPFNQGFIHKLLETYNDQSIDELKAEMTRRGKNASLRAQHERLRKELYDSLDPEVKAIIIGIDDIDVYDIGINVHVLLPGHYREHVKDAIQNVQKHLKEINQYVRRYVEFSSERRKTPTVAATILPMCKLVDVTMESASVLILHYQLKNRLINVLSNESKEGDA